jgi:DNA repair photolyase
MERISQTRIKGRGAVSNPAGRFEKLQTLPVDDGWSTCGEPEPRLDTVVRPEKTCRIISSNDSPDIPFGRSVNPYKGCEHGCVYCFARPSHSYLGLSPGLDFETQIFSKPDAGNLLREAFEHDSYVPEVIALGANTDPYQPAEKKLWITRDLLEVFLEYRHPVSIITKSTTVLRDSDLLEALAKQNLVRVYCSVTTLEPELARRMEPRASSPGGRLRALGVLSEIGVSTGVLTSPMIPGLNDWEMERILEAASEAGATHAGYTMLRLPHELKGLFESWLDANYPERAQKVLNGIRGIRGGALNTTEYGSRMHGSGPYAELLKKRFAAGVKRFGLNETRRVLRTDLFERPEKQGHQMSLFAG